MTLTGLAEAEPVINSGGQVRATNHATNARKEARKTWPCWY